MALWSKPYFALLISLYQREIPRRNLDILIWSGAILIFLFLLAISVGVPDIRERVFHTATAQMQFVMYALSLVLIVVSGTIASRMRIAGPFMSVV